MFIVIFPPEEDPPSAEIFGFNKIVRCAIIVKNMNDKFNPSNIQLIVGLGNPGGKYESTFHNFGFLFVNYLAKKISGGKFKKYTRGGFVYLNAPSFTFVKPILFMNESGKAVKKSLDFLKLDPREMLIVHDENDIPFGKYKIDFGRGDAGHGGISSIISSLRTKNFWRLRIGIQIGEENNKKKAGDFVLSPLSKQREKELLEVFEKINKTYFV